MALTFSVRGGEHIYQRQWPVVAAVLIATLAIGTAALARQDAHAAVFFPGSDVHCQSGQSFTFDGQRYCFDFGNHTRDWPSACSAYGGTLASVTSLNEVQTLRNILQALPSSAQGMMIADSCQATRQRALSLPGFRANVATSLLDCTGPHVAFWQNGDEGRYLLDDTLVDGHHYGVVCELPSAPAPTPHATPTFVPPQPTPTPTGCVCPQVYDPVCGKDGRTYSNSCFAGCAGVPVKHPGQCQVAPKPTPTPVKPIPSKPFKPWNWFTHSTAEQFQVGAAAGGHSASQAAQLNTWFNPWGPVQQGGGWQNFTSHAPAQFQQGQAFSLTSFSPPAWFSRWW